MIQDLLDHSDDWGQSHDYVSCAFSQEFTDKKVLKQAERYALYAKNTVIKMHKFILSLLSKEM